MTTTYYITSTKYSIHERQNKSGKVYDVIFRVITQDGFTKQKKLSGFTSKALAKKAHTEFITTKCEFVSENPFKRKDLQKKDAYVKDLISKYIATLPNQNKESTIYDKKNIYAKFIIPQLGQFKIYELTKEKLYQWQDDIWSMKNPKTGEHYSYQYLSNIRTQLSSFLSWCETRYGIPNAFSQIQKPKRRTQKSEMQIWTRDDFDRFISVVDNPMYHALFTMLFFTGRRKGEVLALTNEDIHPSYINFSKTYSRKTIDGTPYKITSTKADKVSSTPICKTLQKELESYQGDSPFFFGGEYPLHENNINNNFKKYCKIAGIQPIRIHDLRHSFVSMLIHLGANFMVVADLIGDTVEQVTKTYAHMYNEDKIKIIEMLD